MIRSFKSRWRAWQRRRQLSRMERAAKANKSTPLREFIYLDEVSTYSLLTSRIGPVAAEYTENQAESLRSEFNFETAAGSDLVGKVGASALLESTSSSSAQILRRATVQSTFRALRQLEERNIRPLDEQAAVVSAIGGASLDDLLANPVDPWVIAASSLERGSLFEASVQLETDALYQMAVVVRTMEHITIDAPSILSADQIPQFRLLRDGAALLEMLMVGLVPIEGILTNYRAIEFSGQRYLVRSELLTGSLGASSRPVSVVGVAEASLFWRDQRRILFSKGEYRMLVRLGQGGLVDDWNPIKLADLIKRISPPFARALSELRSSGLPSSETAAPKTAINTLEVLERFCALVGVSATELNSEEADFVSALAVRVDIDSLEGQREAFDELLTRLESTRGISVPRNELPLLRQMALKPASQPPALGSPTSASPDSDDEHPWFLDSEIVAIYW